MLKDISTKSEKYKYGVTDLNFSICFNKECDDTGKEQGNCFIAKSLRDDDCFSKCKDSFVVTHIFSKQNSQIKYNKLEYCEKELTVDIFPAIIKEMLSDEILYTSNKLSKSDQLVLMS